MQCKIITKIRTIFLGLSQHINILALEMDIIIINNGINFLVTTQNLQTNPRFLYLTDEIICQGV